MRSIGFDLPAGLVKAAALELAGMLTGLERELVIRGMTGRELAVAFDHHRGRIEPVTRSQPLGPD